MTRSSIIGIFTALAVLTVPTAQAAEPKTFRDCTECPEMVVVPSGEAFIGSPQSVTQHEGVRFQVMARQQNGADTVLAEAMLPSSALLELAIDADASLADGSNQEIPARDFTL